MKKTTRKLFLCQLGVSLITAPFAALGISAISKKEMTDGKGNDCGYTDAATEGPFFVKNTAQTVNLNYTNLTGIPMVVSGRIYGDKEGKLPLPNAKIEIWHCDADGIYHPEGNQDIAHYEESEIALRGFVISDKKGAYSFRSIVPGLYSGRRRHIHYKISAKGYRTLTTQSYWLSEKGDQREHIDRTDRNTEDCRYIDFKSRGTSGVEGIFNIYMKKI
ncbi:hypothetical protein QQ008_26245 [Fulvivirgaceae bacterium BMA10]|uniref:Intradiol ring-cleavage dioxygenases domain-containing protein n=1 Tax=Splendidivirga corallicola TaxID=3051826 RepID=A0ABT8KZA0_9BACT|nr:hypothetical protein [Fulvivirgaceae bacterium BMA10]